MQSEGSKSLVTIESRLWLWFLKKYPIIDLPCTGQVNAWRLQHRSISPWSRPGISIRERCPQDAQPVFSEQISHAQHPA